MPNEIDTFISEKATGREVPAPLDYLHQYVQKNGKDLKAETIPEQPMAVNKSLPPRPDRSATATKKTLSKIQTNPVRQAQPPDAKESLESKLAKRMDIRRKPVNSTSASSKPTETMNNEEKFASINQSMDSMRSNTQPIGELEELLKKFENGESKRSDVAKKTRSNSSMRFGTTQPLPNPPAQPLRPDRNHRQSMIVQTEVSEKQRQPSNADRRQSAPPPSNSRSLTPTTTSSTEILSPPKSPRPQSQQLSPRLPASDVTINPITPPLSASPTDVCSSPVFLQQAYHPPQESDQWKVSGSSIPHQQQQQQQQQYSPQGQTPVHQSQQQMPQQTQQQQQQHTEQHPPQQQYINPGQHPQQYMRSQTLPASFASTSPMMAPYAPPSPATVNSPWLSPQLHMMQPQSGHFEPPRSPVVHAAQASPMMAARSPMMQPRSPMMQSRPVTPVMQPSPIQKPATLPDGRPVVHWGKHLLLASPSILTSK